MTDLSNVTEEQVLAIRKEFAGEIDKALRAAASMLALADLASGGTRGLTRDADVYVKIGAIIEKQATRLPGTQLTDEEREKQKETLAEVKQSLFGPGFPFGGVR